MSKPMLLADFVRLPPTVRGDVVEGLAAAIDIVAERGPPSHRFLRFGWYAAALAAYGGAARTLVVEEDGAPVVALPFVGHRRFGVAAVPGCRWPFRSVGVALGATDAALRIALVTLAAQINGLRLGPICDGDPAATALIAIARAQRWIALERTPGRAAPTPLDDRAFWRAAVADPVLARMIRQSEASIDGAGGAIAIETGDGIYRAARNASGQPIPSPESAPTREWLLLRPGLPALLGRMFGWVWTRTGRPHW
ncbi:hypothetical protein ASF00_01925 [Sphingomonas sp. Leaf34]|uniref:hypothetical protein n=1 Tax=Sphingomonas sp. Leaf34 TaxID=1736216 RepID=UPI000701A8FB|nr:hypothetical protein [Sphingomonas sp. Leaf34]KQN31584.1 hypothetical protein ASF00_01925 [Sphingomonas sp. Leaf34]